MERMRRVGRGVRSRGKQEIVFFVMKTPEDEDPGFLQKLIQVSLERFKSWTDARIGGNMKIECSQGRFIGLRSDLVNEAIGDVDSKNVDVRSEHASKWSESSLDELGAGFRGPGNVIGHENDIESGSRQFVGRSDVLNILRGT